MTCTWNSGPTGFTLLSQSLAGELALEGDSPGLRRMVRRSGKSRAPVSANLLSVRSVEILGQSSSCTPPPGTLSSTRVRGSIIDVFIEPSRRCSVGLQLYWSCSSSSQLDLEVLAKSAQPVESFEVLTESCYTSGEVLIPATSGWVAVQDAARLGAEYLVFARDREAGAMSLDGRYPADQSETLAGFYRKPIVLYRPPRQRWSYAELTTPESCVRLVSKLERSKTSVSFGLFGADLEKGVIFRGLVRGVFLPRAGDTRHSLRQFTRLCNERPRISV